MIRNLLLLLVTVALLACGGEALSFELIRVIEVDGRQGVAVDENRYYVSSSAALYVYDKDGELLLSNDEPFIHLEKDRLEPGFRPGGGQRSRGGSGEPGDLDDRLGGWDLPLSL